MGSLQKGLYSGSASLSTRLGIQPLFLTTVRRSDVLETYARAIYLPRGSLTYFFPAHLYLLIHLIVHLQAPTLKQITHSAALLCADFRVVAAVGARSALFRGRLAYARCRGFCLAKGFIVVIAAAPAAPAAAESGLQKRRGP